jgi:hypothetical protein
MQFIPQLWIIFKETQGAIALGFPPTIAKSQPFTSKVIHREKSESPMT